MLVIYHSHTAQKAQPVVKGMLAQMTVRTMPHTFQHIVKLHLPFNRELGHHLPNPLKRQHRKRRVDKRLHNKRIRFILMRSIPTVPMPRMACKVPNSIPNDGCSVPSVPGSTHM